MLKGNYSLPLDLLDPASSEGELLPMLTYTVSTAEVFMFSAITWNRHRIHYDKDQAIKEGHDGVLVQRGLIGNILCRYIMDIFIEPVIKKLNWKVLSSTLAGSTLTASGLIAQSTKTVIGMELNLTLLLSNGDEKVCQASAEIHELISRPDRPFTILSYKN